MDQYNNNKRRGEGEEEKKRREKERGDNQLLISTIIKDIHNGHGPTINPRNTPQFYSSLELIYIYLYIYR